MSGFIPSLIMFLLCVYDVVAQLKKMLLLIELDVLLSLTLR